MYLKFLARSTNQHGVHSPFVYDLVTKCFYNKKQKVVHKAVTAAYKTHFGHQYFNLKSAKLLNRIPSYFKSKKALVLSDHNTLVSEILSIDNGVEIYTSTQTNDHFDIIFADLYKLHQYVTSETLSSVTHNDSTIITTGMYTSMSETKAWQEIKAHPKITVTVDTFDLGFVFIRTEQAKEHFTIRC